MAPALAESLHKSGAVQNELRTEYGTFINFVHPVEHQGRKMWALGSRLYPDRPPSETFHEFILSILRSTLGEPWRREQESFPPAEQHFIYGCLSDFAKWKKREESKGPRAGDGLFTGNPDGWTKWLISLAWDIATLVHVDALPDSLVSRLRGSGEFQGARYEIAVAAIFARLGCELKWLDEDPASAASKHAEFVAKFPPTGEAFVVEAKSRHREGVMHRPGDVDLEQLFRRDNKRLRRLFNSAAKKAPGARPYYIFIDMNAPVSSEEMERRWKSIASTWIKTLPGWSEEQPANFNGLWLTNFGFHFDKDQVSTEHAGLVYLPEHTEVEERGIFPTLLRHAMDTYGNVPAFAPDGGLLR